MTTKSSTSTTGRKQRKIAPLLDPEFRSAVSMTTTTTTLQFTNGAANVLHDCQEEFIVQLTHQLAEALKKDKIGLQEAKLADKRKIRWVQPHHVQVAMTAMGLSDVLEEAMECLQTLEQEEEDGNDDPKAEEEPEEHEPPAKKKRKRKTSKKKGEFSAEMIAEQERLLAASRQKLS